jgi:hypothetical protein
LRREAAHIRVWRKKEKEKYVEGLSSNVESGGVMRTCWVNCVAEIFYEKNRVMWKQIFQGYLDPKR